MLNQWTKQAILVFDIFLPRHSEYIIHPPFLREETYPPETRQENKKNMVPKKMEPSVAETRYGWST